MEEKDYEKAANIVLYNVFECYGVKGIMSALDDATSFVERKKMWRGLD